MRTPSLPPCWPAGWPAPGLDVFAEEPKVPEDLLALENVVLLPHLGSGTHETRAAMAELTLANLRSFVTTGAVS